MIPLMVLKLRECVSPALRTPSVGGSEEHRDLQHKNATQVKL